jgi:fructokinase
MKRIVCFGEALIDFLAQPPESPQAPRAFLQFAGGAPANVAVAAARLGARVDFVGMLGNDMFGDFLLESFRAAGVGLVHVARTSQAKTALAFVALDADGERSFSFYRPPAADLLFRIEHFRSGCFEQIGAFHVCSNSLTSAGFAMTTIEGMQRARSAGAVVSLDLNLRPALWPADLDPHSRLWDVLLRADVVKLARNELDYLAADVGGDDAVLDRLWGGTARCLVVTDGAAPILWRTQQSGGVFDGYRVKAIDTTAAGDAFVGGLLAHLAERDVDGKRLDEFLADKKSIDNAIRYAAAVGALAVTRHGAFAAMPDRQAVQDLMQEQA